MNELSNLHLLVQTSGYYRRYQYDKYILDYLALILPNTQRMPDDDTKLKLLTSENIDYVSISSKYKKPFVKYKKPTFIETIQSDIKLNDGNIVKFMNWYHKSPTPKTDSSNNNKQISPIVALRFLNSDVWNKPIHNLSFVSFDRDVFDKTNNKKLWFFDKAILPGWTQGSKYDNSKFHHETVFDYIRRYKPTEFTNLEGVIDNRCASDSKHCAYNKFGWTYRNNIALERAGYNYPIEYSEVINGVTKYYIGYYTSFRYGTGYKSLDEGQISDVLEEHYNSNAYNKFVHLLNIVKEQKEILHLNIVYLQKIIIHIHMTQIIFYKYKKTTRVNLEGLTLYNIKPKYNLKLTNIPVFDRKFTKEFDELKSDDFVKFDVHKEHIIGHYQMNGLNRIPNDEAKILSPEFTIS